MSELQLFTCFDQKKCRVKLWFVRGKICRNGVRKGKCHRKHTDKPIIVETNGPMDRGFYLKWCLPEGMPQDPELLPNIWAKASAARIGQPYTPFHVTVAKNFK